MCEVNCSFIYAHYIETRYFDVQPEDHVARLSNPACTSGSLCNPANPYEAITFTCSLIKTFREPAPIITWQVIENDILRNITVTDIINEEVVLQHDHIGYYQLHNPNINNDGLSARCVATSSENSAEVVFSNWAVAKVTSTLYMCIVHVVSICV